tara:strand:+ start:1328 stop:1825 length:498 start_codon:yes stop_codon:yes gene_type:complete
MQLDDLHKSKTRFHLGFNAGAQIPAGDRARLEEAMALIPDEYWHNEIIYQITRCDTAWKASAFFPDDYTNNSGTGNFNFSRLEQIAGDVSRSIATTDPLKADADFREVYLRECDRLAESLYVPNYRRPETRRYAFERAGAEFIMAIPGPADTAVGSRIALNLMWR